MACSPRSALQDQCLSTSFQRTLELQSPQSRGQPHSLFYTRLALSISYQITFFSYLSSSSFFSSSPASSRQRCLQRRSYQSSQLRSRLGCRRAPPPLWKEKSRGRGESSTRRDSQSAGRFEPDIQYQSQRQNLGLVRAEVLVAASLPPRPGETRVVLALRHLLVQQQVHQLLRLEVPPRVHDQLLHAVLPRVRLHPQAQAPRHLLLPARYLPALGQGQQLAYFQQLPLHQLPELLLLLAREQQVAEDQVAGHAVLADVLLAVLLSKLAGAPGEAGQGEGFVVCDDGPGLLEQGVLVAGPEPVLAEVLDEGQDSCQVEAQFHNEILHEVEGLGGRARVEPVQLLGQPRSGQLLPVVQSAHGRPVAVEVELQTVDQQHVGREGVQRGRLQPEQVEVELPELSGPQLAADGADEGDLALLDVLFDLAHQQLLVPRQLQGLVEVPQQLDLPLEPLRSHARPRLVHENAGHPVAVHCLRVGVLPGLSEVLERVNRVVQLVALHPQGGHHRPHRSRLP